MRVREFAAMPDIADPRRFPDPASAPDDAREAHALARASLAAASGLDAQSCDAALDALIDRELTALDSRLAGLRLAAWLESAPSVEVYRHVWRALVRRAAAPPPGEGIVATLFAIPLVLVAGVTGGAGARVALPGTLPDGPALAGLLLEHGALGGNRSFTLAASLVACGPLEVAALPSLLVARQAVLSRGEPLDLPPAPLALPAGESVHLRFLVGSAVGAAGIDVTRDATTGRWGMPLTKALSAQLAAPGATLLALPRPALSPLAALAQGRTAQRDVSAQLFASNAVRDLRAKFGEPVAVISAHRAADAPGGGELRLSLSSPLSPRDAQGYRCPVLAGERAGDAAKMLADLCADARIADVRIAPGVHDDRDPLTGGPLMFKPATLPGASRIH